MTESPALANELEQSKADLARSLSEQIDLNVREAAEIIDRFHGEIARSLQSDTSVELADFGYFSLRDGFSSSCGYHNRPLEPFGVSNASGIDVAGTLDVPAAASRCRPEARWQSGSRLTGTHHLAGGWKPLLPWKSTAPGTAVASGRGGSRRPLRRALTNVRVRCFLQQVAVDPRCPTRNNTVRAVEFPSPGIMTSESLNSVFPPLRVVLSGQGDPSAHYRLGCRYETGRGMPQDYAEAAKCYRKAADQGYARAQYNLARMYAHGRGVPSDLVGAAHWYRKAADQGYARAQYKLGCLYAHGEGVPQNDGEAAAWVRRAADQGFATAQYDLGCMYALGRGVTQDSVAAAVWSRKAADQGDAGAQFSLGLAYDSGEGVRQDYAEAMQWYRRAADGGIDAALNNLGRMYEDGRGVPQDYSEAVNWFRKGAERGNAAAQFNLGRMYENGRGVPRDYAEAMTWYAKSAEQGTPEAQFNRGTMYYTGRGVPQNFSAAHNWFQLAASGFPDSNADMRNRAARNRDLAAARMKSTQIADSVRRARGWRPT